MNDGIALLLLGAVTLWFLGRTVFFFWRGLRSINWEKTTGTITEAWVNVVTDSENDSRQRNYLKATYQYTVDGQTYESKRIRYGDIENEGRRKQKVLEKKAREYRENPQRTVYYNPQNPQQAVLERGLRPLSLVTNLIYGLFMLAMTIIFVVMRLNPES